MTYIELTIEISDENKMASDVIIAQLSEVGFDGFIEEDNKVIAYIASDKYSEELLKSCSFFSYAADVIKYQTKPLADVNWNALWESNFEPVFIKNCIIRAPFHELPKDIDYDIVIEPKMSFGTGHHETTSMVVEAMLDIDFKSKKVLDMGCGTGVLAILASMKNAAIIDSVDNDIWSYNNTLENIIRNKTENVSVFLGDVQTVKDMKYDIVLANITRNILIEFIPYFSQMQNAGGTLILSGFLNTDVEAVVNFANLHHYNLKKIRNKNNWAALELFKV